MMLFVRYSVIRDSKSVFQRDLQHIIFQKLKGSKIQMRPNTIVKN